MLYFWLGNKYVGRGDFLCIGTIAGVEIRINDNISEIEGSMGRRDRINRFTH